MLTLTASATPTWTLARFKGPGPASGGLLSGTQTNTHTLTIVLGSNQNAVGLKVNAFAKYPFRHASRTRCEKREGAVVIVRERISSCLIAAISGSTPMMFIRRVML